MYSNTSLRAIIACVVAILGLAGQCQGQVLTSSGPCPGLQTFQVTGATPNGRVAFIHAASTGTWTIPFGVVCWGTTTGLSAPVTLAGFVPTNGSGAASANFTVPAALCNNRFLQAVDAIACTTSNVILIQ